MGREADCSWGTRSGLGGRAGLSGELPGLEEPLGPKAGWCWLLELVDRALDAGGELEVLPEDGALVVGVVEVGVYAGVVVRTRVGSRSGSAEPRSGRGGGGGWTRGSGTCA